MFKNIWKKLRKNNSHNERGSVLTVSLIVMVVLASSVAAITQVTANQLQNTSITLDTINDESTGKMLIKQSITELRLFLDPEELPNGSFDTSEYTALLASFETNYGVIVTDVSGTDGFELFRSTEDNGESRAFRFAIPLDTGNDLVMYSYVSTAGAAIEEIEVMDFSIATNGDIILNGGYYKNASFFADNIRFGQVSPYIKKTNNGNTLTPAITPAATLAQAISQEYFPEFSWWGEQAEIYYTSSFTYCGATCFDVAPTIEDNFVINENLYEDIIGSALDTGNIPDMTIIGDFFGGYDLDQTILDYITKDGPTLDREISNTLSLDTVGQDILDYYSGEEEETCEWVRRNNRWRYICTWGASANQYTDITNLDSFTPQSANETIEYGAIYDGDLIVNRNLTLENNDTETLIVNGDLIFQNTRDIKVTGMIVVLGDLIFEGETVEIVGGFYVTGESRFNFLEGYGIESGDNNEDWSFSLFSKKSVIVESMWESHYSNPFVRRMDWYIYTDESIYIDAVNSMMDIEGNFHARALGLNGPFITLENESQVQIHGIIINSFNGYIDDDGNVYRNYFTERFTINALNESGSSGGGGGWGWGNISPGFDEEPDYDPLIVSQGEYSFETSEFSIE